MKLQTLQYYSIFTAIILLFNTALQAIDLSDDAPSDSYISIQGSSTINEFELINSNPAISDSELKVAADGRYRKMKIEVDEFTAGNKRMIEDFRSMLNASEYPHIEIAIERREMAEFEETSGLSVFSIIITITGISREYKVPCEVYSNVESGYRIAGRFDIKLSDFEIDPPEKVFGIIKVKNKVFINFVLSFKPEETLTEKI